MRSFFKMIKPLDIIIVLGLVFLSFVPTIIFSWNQTQARGEDTDLYAVITVDNEEVKRINLSKTEGTEVFDITSEDGGINRVEVKQDKIRVIYANCPDQIDVKQGEISQPGEMIICLPHKFVIEIVTQNTQADDLIISS